MNEVNPFSDPEFKKQIISSGGDSNDDLQSIITGAPKIPDSKSLRNVILDASALAKKDKKDKAQEITRSLNKIFTDYNKEYGMDLSIDFSSLSRTLVNVADPQKRRVLELYVSEVMKSIRPILILHLVQRLSLAIDYVTQPERMFGQDISTADIFIIVEKLISYIQELEEIKDSVTISGSDLELKKLADEKKDSTLGTKESRQAVDDFMKLLQKDNGIKIN